MKNRKTNFPERYRYQHSLLTTLLFAFLLVLGSCSDDDIEDTTPPDQVSNLEVVAGDGEVTLSWTEPDDADLENIEISYTPGTNPTLTQTAGLESMTVSGLTNDTEYTFAVKTVDEEGNKSEAVAISAIPNPPFVVVFPDQNDYASAGGGTFTTDGNGHLVITVTFNRAVDVNSVNPGQTIYFEADIISQGTVEFSNDNKTVTYTTTEVASDLGTFSPDMYFDFLLLGNDAGNGTITDSNGVILDGDKDGESGGNYVLNLILIG
jgi:hypothetical protein